MLQFLKRRRQQRDDEARKRQEMIALTERGYREIDTAMQLVKERLSGQLPSNVRVVAIGDGFYVEQHPDGSRSKVLMSQIKPAAVHAISP